MISIIHYQLKFYLLLNRFKFIMKYCPNCQTSYTDDSLKFCLQDGAPLTEIVNSNEADTPTVAFNNEETVISSRQVEPIRVPVQNPTVPAWEQNWQDRGSTPPPTAAVPPLSTAVSPPPVVVSPAPQLGVKKPNTGSTVLLTALATLLLLGAAAAAGYFMNNRKTEVVANVNSDAPKTNRPVNSNSVNNTESNVNTIAPTPRATPSPKPTLNPETASAVTNDVQGVIDNWKNASENGDLDAHLSQYARTVDYYKAGKIGSAAVRADKQRAFETFDSINFNISNMKVTPDASGEKATAVFDKEWKFEGEGKYSAGKVQQLLNLTKMNGKWLITGEKDLKVYYVDK